MPGGVVRAARLVRRELCVVCLVEVARITSVSGVMREDLCTFREPDDAVEKPRGMKKVKMATKGNAICGVAIQGVEGVDDLRFVAVLEFQWERREFVLRQFRRDMAKGRGGDQLRVAAPGIVPRVHPPLKILGLGTIDGKMEDDTVFLRLDLSNTNVHGGDAEGPEEQAEGDPEEDGKNSREFRG